MGPKQSWMAKSILSGIDRKKHPIKENPYNSVSQIDINITRESKFTNVEDFERENHIKEEKTRLLKESNM